MGETDTHFGFDSMFKFKHAKKSINTKYIAEKIMFDVERV